MDRASRALRGRTRLRRAERNGRMPDDGGGGKRGQRAMSLLLVMSDDVDARLASYLLAQIDQHVVMAGTLAEARRYLSERVWSAVILDTVLPDGSGFDLLRILTAMNFE